MTTFNTRVTFDHVRNTAAGFTANNPVLGYGVIGIETDTGRFKIGDGQTAWSTLTYSKSPVDWEEIDGTPAAFTPTAHTHAPSAVGLGNVDNTADAAKPVSTAQAAADAAVASAAAADATSKANAAQAHAIQRANHTGTQAISTVSGLQTALDLKQPAGSYAAASHGHAIGEVTGLQVALDAKATTSDVTAAVAAVVDAAPAALDTLNELAAALGDDANFASTVTTSLAGKAAAVHAHVIANVTGLQAALDGKQASGSYAAATHGHTIADVTGLQAALDGKQAAGSYAATVHTHEISDVTGLQTALDGKQATLAAGTEGDVLTYSSGSWVAAGGGGGGGGDYLPLAGGTMTGNIAFDGTSGQAIGKGWFDTERGGNYGISLYCSIGYQLNWQAGWLICTEQDLTTPRPLYLDGEAGTTLRVWDAGQNEGVEISYTGITFADGTTQTTAAASLPSGTEGDVLTYSAGSWVAAAPSGGGGGIPAPPSPSQGDVLVYDTGNWVSQAPSTGLPGGMSDGDVLTYSSSVGAWVSQAPAAQLPTSAANGDVLSWNGSQWVAVMSLTPSLPSAAQGQYLKYDGTNWIAASLTSSASAGQYLQYDGSNWVAAAFTISDYSASVGYGVGDLVVLFGVIWRSTQAGMGNEPGLGSNYWAALTHYLPLDEFNDGDLLAWSSSANRVVPTAPPSGGGGGYTAPLFARMTNDEQWMSVTASSNLSLSPIVGSATYYIEGLAVIEGQADAAIGLKLTAGASDGEVLLDHDYLHDAYGNYWATNRNTDQTNSTAAYSNSWNSTVTAPIRFRGWVTTGAISSTNIALHFGSTSGMATITLKAGSWIMATKVA